MGAVPAHVLRGSIRLGVESNATECIFRQAWLRPGLTATQQPLVAGGEHLRRCDCSSRVCVAQPVAGSRNGGNFYTESQLPPGAQPATEASSPELRPPPSPPLLLLPRDGVSTSSARSASHTRRTRRTRSPRRSAACSATQGQRTNGCSRCSCSSRHSRRTVDVGSRRRTEPARVRVPTGRCGRRRG